MTVKTSGTYLVNVDEAAAGGAATNTYHLSLDVIPGDTARTYTSYAGSTGPIADLATTDFTVNIPDSKIIDNLRVTINATHPATADLDVSLISPDGNEVVLFDDPATQAGAPAPQINTTLDDEAALPIAQAFTIHSGMHYTPETYSRLNYFKGMQTQGTWTLRVRDDVTANAGTINSWSLDVAQDVAPVCGGTSTTLFTNDFEAGDGGFTHAGTADEWARGLPSGASAPITTCHSGVNCWKTDLTGSITSAAARI